MKSHQTLIFVTEDDPWQWVVAIEHAVSLREKFVNPLIVYITHGYVVEAKNIIKRFFGWKGSRQNVQPTLKEYGIDVLVVNSLVPSIRLPRFSFSELNRIIYPGTVASTGKRNLHSIQDRWTWAMNFQKAVRISNTLVSLKSPDSFGLCYVPNGKVVSAAVTVKSLRFLGYEVKILESGAKPDRLHVWNYSAQSQSEANKFLSLMWENASLTDRESKSANYFNIRRSGLIQDPYHLVSWAKLTTSGLLPEFEYDKKVATFYSSSQIEQVGTDVIPAGNFQDQGEALKSVLESLNPRDWVVYLRKHPIPPGAKSHFEDEDDIWTKTTGFNHLRIIRGDSKIDSFALAAKSNIVFHYNSSIGAEIIFAQLAPVITTGLTSWATLNAGYSALNSQELRDVLNTPELQIENPQKILPWGLFHSELGTPFTLATLGDQNTWKINGKNIHPNFKSHLINKIFKATLLLGWKRRN